MSRIAAVLLALLAMVSPTPADPLQVGNSFPDVPLLHVAPNRTARVKNLRDVLKTKSIVFVFASW